MVNQITTTPGSIPGTFTYTSSDFNRLISGSYTPGGTGSYEFGNLVTGARRPPGTTYQIMRMRREFNYITRTAGRVSTGRISTIIRALSFAVNQFNTVVVPETYNTTGYIKVVDCGNPVAFAREFDDFLGICNNPFVVGCFPDGGGPCDTSLENEPVSVMPNPRPPDFWLWASEPPSYLDGFGRRVAFGAQEWHRVDVAGPDVVQPPFETTTEPGEVQVPSWLRPFPHVFTFPAPFVPVHPDWRVIPHLPINDPVIWEYPGDDAVPQPHHPPPFPRQPEVGGKEKKIRIDIGRIARFVQARVYDATEWLEVLDCLYRALPYKVKNNDRKERLIDLVGGNTPSIKNPDALVVPYDVRLSQVYNHWDEIVWVSDGRKGWPKVGALECMVKNQVMDAVIGRAIAGAQGYGNAKGVFFGGSTSPFMG